MAISGYVFDYSPTECYLLKRYHVGDGGGGGRGGGGGEERVQATPRDILSKCKALVNRFAKSVNDNLLRSGHRLNLIRSL